MEADCASERSRSDIPYVVDSIRVLNTQPAGLVPLVRDARDPYGSARSGKSPDSAMKFEDEVERAFRKFCVDADPSRRNGGRPQESPPGSGSWRRKRPARSGRFWPTTRKRIERRARGSAAAVHYQPAGCRSARGARCPIQIRDDRLDLTVWFETMENWLWRSRGRCLSTKARFFDAVRVFGMTLLDMGADKNALNGRLTEAMGNAAKNLGNKNGAALLGFLIRALFPAPEPAPKAVVSRRLEGQSGDIFALGAFGRLAMGDCAPVSDSDRAEIRAAVAPFERPSQSLAIYQVVTSIGFYLAAVALMYGSPLVIRADPPACGPRQPPARPRIHCPTRLRSRLVLRGRAQQRHSRRAMWRSHARALCELAPSARGASCELE